MALVLAFVIAGGDAFGGVQVAFAQQASGSRLELVGVPVGRGPVEGDPGRRLLGVPVTRSKAPVAGVGSGRATADRVDPTSLAGAVLREANATRRAHGSRGLVTDAALTRAALAYAQELAARGEVEHYSPTPGLRTFRQRIAAAGAHPRLGGENLARLTSSPGALGTRVVGAWLRSPGHRVNLLDPIFSRTGVGVWLGGDGVWYVVQLYATAD